MEYETQYNIQIIISNTTEKKKYLTLELLLSYSVLEPDFLKT